MLDILDGIHLQVKQTYCIEITIRNKDSLISIKCPEMILLIPVGSLIFISRIEKFVGKY